jgi:hypothetical protein
MAMYPICPGVDRHGGLGKVAPGELRPNLQSGARHLNDGSLASSAAAVVGRVFKHIIISLDVDRAPNGIGSAPVARVLPFQPL